MSLKDQQESNLPPLFPYQLVPIQDRAKNSIIYAFETDSQVKYEFVFKSDSDYFPDTSIANYAYSFILTRVSGKVGIVDKRIRDTVIYGLRAAFDANPTLVITYTFSTESDQQKQRALLFRRWFLQCGDQYKSIDFFDSKRIYATALFRNSHPLQGSDNRYFLQNLSE